MNNIYDLNKNYKTLDILNMLKKNKTNKSKNEKYFCKNYR